MAKKNIKFPNLLAEMARNGETQNSIAQLLNLDKSTISCKLSGRIQWSVGEVEILCKHFKKDYYELFK